MMRRWVALGCLAILGTSCMTRELWRDHRSREDLWEYTTETPTTVDSQGRLVLPASDRLREFVDIPENMHHVAFKPIQYPETFAQIVQSSHEHFAMFAFREELDGTIHPVIWISLSHGDATLIDLDGVITRTWLKGFPRFECELAGTATAEVGTAPSSFPRLSVSHDRYRDDDLSIPAKILWTPVTVLGDVVLSPFELLTFKIWW